MATLTYGWLPSQLHNKIETLTGTFLVSWWNYQTLGGGQSYSAKGTPNVCNQDVVVCNQHMHTQFKSEIYLDPFLALINVVLKFNPFHQISYYNNTHGVEWFPLKECF